MWSDLVRPDVHPSCRVGKVGNGFTLAFRVHHQSNARAPSSRLIDLQLLSLIDLTNSQFVVLIFKVIRGMCVPQGRQEHFALLSHGEAEKREQGAKVLQARWVFLVRNGRGGHGISH